MTIQPKKSRIGLVVIKLLVGGEASYLLRKNSKWNDVNFLGGHEKDRDRGSLYKAARRELWEEVPSLRSMKHLDLEPLTGESKYGPIFSRSQVASVEYEVQFFLLRFGEIPNDMLQYLGGRTQNVLVPQEELLRPRAFKVSGLVSHLNNEIPGGLESIPFSLPVDVGSMVKSLPHKDGDQLELLPR